MLILFNTISSCPIDENLSVQLEYLFLVALKSPCSKLALNKTKTQMDRILLPEIYDLSGQIEMIREYRLSLWL